MFLFGSAESGRRVNRTTGGEKSPDIYRPENTNRNCHGATGYQVEVDEADIHTNDTYD